VRDAAKNDPARLEDQEYLNELNQTLEEKSSYLIVRKDKELIYIGEDASISLLTQLPSYGDTVKDEDAGTYIDGDEQVLIATRFHAAIQRGEFEMFLQPKFRLKENTIYGAEALARWHFGEDGYLQPNRFVPALELMGYIKDLDFFILEQLLKYMTKWKKSGKSLFTISTNFSRKHFENGGEAFLQRMHETMDKYDIDPSYIEVEVTESVMTEKLEDLKHCMIELAQMGFRIAIDDFGTGYSSLSVLYEIPANVVKIDKSFTDKVMVDNKGEFVSQMGKFIRAAKEEIVVEGIETEEQRQFLESHGFEYGQGYLFDRPIPADEFERKYL